ncbi:MAG: hypothetical protein A3G15_00950 [Candidatus Levybacteria bacterium RIFCSPLOWO2_12_FULL_40_10]|nr:MAG: hypothetical protein A3G15_00950 [Candidatus Levybacteria bacterium RIFCSPLOWO2_12_FULL_40_10]
MKIYIGSDHRGSDRSVSEGRPAASGSETAVGTTRINNMRIFIGADHRGFKLKEDIKKYFYENGIESEDLGAYELDPKDDYPIYAERVAQKVSVEIKNANASAQRALARREARGILLCGSGVGVDIVANKFEHIRSGLGINTEQVT